MYIRSDQPERARISSLDFLYSAPSKDCRPVLPRGKGMIIVKLPKDPKVVADKVSDTGLSWLAIACVSQKPSHHLINGKKPAEVEKTIKRYVDKLRSDVNKDFGIWVYGGHPQPQYIKEFVSVLVNTAVGVGAQGIIANPEAPWLGAKGHREGKGFMDSLLDQAHKNCLSIGITTYRDVKRNVPWAELSRADFGLPQIYTATPNEAVKAVKDWKDKGFKVVIPLLSTAKKYKPSASAKAMRETYDQVPIPDCAVAWWSWANTTAEARWNVIKNAKMPILCEVRSLWDYFSNVKPLLEGLGLAGTAQAYVRVPIANKPTPCRFYTIKSGVDKKGLIDLAGRAYGTQTDKTKLAQWINNHPYNRRFWKADLANKDFPQGRISFSPGFSRDIAKQAEATGKAPSGGAFATIFIPPPPAWLQKSFPSCSVTSAR